MSRSTAARRRCPDPSPVAAGGATCSAGCSGGGGIPNGASTPVTRSCLMPVFCARSGCCTDNRCLQSAQPGWSATVS
eukprot:9776400-Heterocapsa_arctica.AAC.1